MQTEKLDVNLLKLDNLRAVSGESNTYYNISAINRSATEYYQQGLNF